MVPPSGGSSFFDDETLGTEHRQRLLGSQDTVLRDGFRCGHGVRRVRLVLEQDMVDRRKQPAGDGDPGLFRAAPLFKLLVFRADFRILFRTRMARSHGTLNQQRLNVLPGLTNFGYRSHVQLFGA